MQMSQDYSIAGAAQAEQLHRLRALLLGTLATSEREDNLTFDYPPIVPCMQSSNDPDDRSGDGESSQRSGSSFPSGSSGGAGRQQLKDHTRHANLYKTRLCNHYQTHQTCPFGDGCWFAHGEEDLKTMNSSGSSPLVSMSCPSACPADVQQTSDHHSLP
eukprot:NODE_4745_length_767_cov_29.630919_g4398_i0.p1 GENE.NODE_4745_length_767_cov_29.630919_g4398_i0~~NODE_4745_length_767_cov_29.630919_g4398_i0.p1  ORF type:complete len:159 (-),score=17.64 NODE_4745_length_767_cov_29.630919_g4398_i0:119-595(-)